MDLGYWGVVYCVFPNLISVVFVDLFVVEDVGSSSFSILDSAGSGRGCLWINGG